MRRGLAAGAAAAALAALVPPAPAQAQNVGEGGGATQAATLAPPAERLAVTPSGVDMRTGRYNYSATDLSLGGEAGGLALTRGLGTDALGHISPFANFSHNWDIFIDVRNVDMVATGAGPGLRMGVHYAGRSETFEQAAGTSTIEQASRNAFARLSLAGGVYSFHSNDGTVAVFRPIGGISDCSTLYSCAYVSTITHADGTRYSFDYESPAAAGKARLRAVTSNRGYRLVIQYGAGADADFVASACALNLATAPAPAGHVCSAGAAASTAYSYVSHAGGRRLAAVTDAGGAVSSYAYAAITDGLTMAFIRPGETEPWLTNRIWARPDMDSIDEIVTRQVFADSSIWTYSYDTSPQVQGEIPQIAGGSYTDPAGAITQVRYGFPIKPGSTFGNVSGSPEDPATLFFQITPGPVEIIDPLGRTTVQDYCDPYAATHLPPSENHRCLVTPVAVGFSEPDGRATELEWDYYTRNLMRSTRHTRPGTFLDNIVTSATYTCTPAAMVNCGKPTSRTDPRGHVTDLEWHPVHGGLVRETGPAPAPGAPRPETRHEYGQRHAWISNGAGGFVAAGPPIWVRTATSSCRASAATGNPAAPCATAGDEVRTTYDYGPEGGAPGNLLLRGQAVTATDGGVTTTLRSCYAYDGSGRRIAETQPRANLASCPATLSGTTSFTSATRSDAWGRTVGTISADPDPQPGGGSGPLPFLAVRNTHDDAGRLVRVETGTLATWQSEAVAPANWAGFTVLRTLETAYDSMNRKLRDSLREGAAGAVRTVTDYSYDTAGRLECTAVRMSPSAFGAAPVPACTPTAPGSHGPDRITRNRYDAAGQRLQLRAGVETSDEAAEATLAYNVNGQVTTLIDGNGNRAELRFDGHGRQDRWTFPSTTRPAFYNDSNQETALATAGQVNLNDFEEYGYDLAGNRISLTKRDGSTIGYHYDGLNRMTAKIVPERPAPHPHPLSPAQTRDVYYGYDLRGLQTYARFDSAAGEGVTSEYDGFGRLRSTTLAMDGASRTLSYQYDANSNRVRITHPDGPFFTTNHDGLDRASWSFDATGYALIHYVYDAHGRRVARSQGNSGGNDYAWDPLGRLTLMTQAMAGTSADAWVTFGRNPAGQIASISRDNDAYASSTAYNVARPYVTNGLNQYTQAGPASFTYDKNGNLTADGATAFTYDVENRLVSATGARNASLRYDPLGRLYKVAAGATATRFLHDGDAMVAEYNSTGALTHRYFHGTGADAPMIDYAGASLTQPYYLHADHQGSIVALSGAGAVAQAINAYNEYGIPNATNHGRFQYTGQIWLDELGMYYYKARIYSPTLGRFLQSDPIGYEGGINLYAYVGNDPVNLTDPSGLRNCTPGDPACIETPESEQMPGEPPPPSPEESEMAEVVVVGERQNRGNFGGDNEDAFVLDGGQVLAREPLSTERVDCGNRNTPDIQIVEHFGPLAPGQMGIHTHGDAIEQFPGPVDGNTPRNTRSGVAGVYSRTRSFTIRAFDSGTYRTIQRSGPPMSTEERGQLVENMQNWERINRSNRPVATPRSGNQPARVRRQQICRGRR